MECLFFHVILLVSGYKTYLDYEKKTCDRDFKLRAFNRAFSECAAECDKLKNCKFFYFRDTSYCEIFSCCDKYRVSKAGQTFMKQDYGKFLNIVKSEIFCNSLYYKIQSTNMNRGFL